MTDTALLVILLSLVTAIAWGFSDFIAAKASQSVGPIVSAFLVNLVGAVAFFAVYVLFLRPDTPLTSTGVLLAVGGGMGMAVGALAFFKALKAGPVSLVSPISSAYPIITTGLALLVFGAYLSFGQMVGISLVIVGILLAAELIGAKLRVKAATTGPRWVLITVLGWGIGLGLVAQAIQHLGWENATLIEVLSMVVSMAIVLPAIKGKEEISLSRLWRMAGNKFVAGAGVIQLVGVFALNIGYSYDVLSGGAIVTAISACYPVLTIFLAFRHLKERVQTIPLVGAFACIAGVVILALS